MSSEMLRVLLLVSLGVVGYLLILAWNEDYGTAPPASKEAAQRQPLESVPSVPTAGSQAPASGVPGAGAPASGVPASGVPASDVPMVTSEGNLPAAVPPTTEARVRAPSAGELVHVSTDVLNVWIDTQGGDIVKANLADYPVSLSNPDVPVVILDRTRTHIYVAQSGLIGARGPDLPGKRPVYSVASNEFVLGEGQDVLQVALDYVSSDGLEATKTYVFHRGDHLIELDVTLRNGSSEAWKGNLYAQLKRDGGNPEGQKGFTMGPRPYVGAAVTTPTSRYEKVKFGDLDEAPLREEMQGGWIALLQHYFLSAWIGPSDQTNVYYGRHHSDGTYLVGLTTPAQTVAPGASGSFTAELYVGPKVQQRLREIAPNLNLTVDYGFLWWLAIPLFDLMTMLHGVVLNWGLAIILLTLVVKVVLYPLSAASYRSMANMRRVAPELKRVQERYSDDRERLMREMQALYKKEKINPLGGCLPMVLQMPVFFALYWVLYESVELRQAAFIPGWIDDLSVKDPLFILPLLMGASMLGQQMLSPPAPDPMQQRMMRLMPIVFTGLFLFFPSGLVLYWLVNNVLSMTQQWFITRQLGQAGARRS